MPDDTEGVEVGCAGRRSTEGLLRAEVGRRPEQVSGAGVSRGVGRTCDAEVGELHQAVRTDQDVGRLHVSVDHLGLVGDPERQRALSEHRPHLFGGERATLADHLGQRPALDQLHDQEGQSVVLAVVEQGGDVGVDQCCGVQRLVTEPQGEQLLVIGVWPHDLEGDPTLEDGVGRGPDISHATRRDAGLQQVPSAEQQPWLDAAHLVDLTGHPFAPTWRATVLPRVPEVPAQGRYCTAALAPLTPRCGLTRVIVSLLGLGHRPSGVSDARTPPTPRRRVPRRC